MKFLAEQLRDAGYDDVEIDAAGNAIASITNVPTDERFVLVCAHADTACEVAGELKVRDENGYLCAHGICDNAAGMTAALTFARLLKRVRLDLHHNYLIVFTVGEEGLGGKRGMRHLIERYDGRLAYVVNVESHNIGDVISASIGQERLRLTVRTKQLGGHSWSDFGEPNAAVTLARITADISRLPLPDDTSFNITALESGQGINVIPDFAACSFEARALQQQHLDTFLDGVRDVLARYVDDRITIDTETIGTVTAASIDDHHPLIRTIQDVHASLGITTRLRSGNTDGDISLAAGIPTITLCTGNGDRIHSMEERLEKESFPRGVEQVLVGILALDREMQ